MKRTILIVFLLTAAIFAQDKPKTAPIKTDVSPNAPRYQLFVNPEARADTFLLDTVTGKIWRMTQMADALGDPKVWKAEARFDDDAQEVAWWKTHLTKQQAKDAGIQ